MNYRILLAILAVPGAICVGAAQTAAPNPCDAALTNIVDKARLGVENGLPDPFGKAFSPSNVTDFIGVLSGVAAGATCLIVNNKTEVQGGAAPSDTGSTAIAQKGGVAQILTFAVENGGLQREVSGTTITFRGKPMGLLEAFKQYDLFQILAEIQKSPVKRFVNKFSFSLAFDTSRGDVPNTFLANSQQLSSWSVRAEILNHRDEKARRYAVLWQDPGLLADASVVGATEVDALHKLREWPGFLPWTVTVQNRMKDLDDSYGKMKAQLADSTTAAAGKAGVIALQEQFKVAVNELIAELAKLPNRPDLGPLLEPVLASWSKLDVRATKIANYVQKGMLLTADWTTKRDLSLPDLYTNTIIWEMSPSKGRVDDFTFNAAVNWYRVAPSTPAGAGRFKDFNAVGEYAFPFGKLEGIGQFILSFTGKYQRVAKSVVNATSLIGPATTETTPPATPPSIFNTTPPAIANLLPTLEGNLGAFQVKLSIPGGKSGIRIPLAFTAATRSEVFDKPDYRANIGITFNIDALFAKK